MKEWLRKLMYGRYGQDELNKVLTVVCLILIIISTFTGLMILYLFGLSLMVFTIFRMLSKNTSRRLQENYGYLKLRGKITGWFSFNKKRFIERNTHCYYKCPSCHTQLRVPKGLGRIRITCTNCQLIFEKTT